MRHSYDGISGPDSLSSMPAPLPASHVLIEHGGRQLALYVAPAPQPRDAAHPPLLLVHSINAGASAAEMRPIFEHYAGRRLVLAIDLPGFGLSDRGEQQYSAKQMAGAVLAALRHLRSHGWDQPADVLALSLSGEFVARAALERPAWFRSVALVSPTGLEDDKAHEPYANGRSRERRSLRRLLALPVVGEALFRVLTTRIAMRWALWRTWGSRRIDERLLDYGHRSAHRAGARQAPLAFLSGTLFTRGVGAIYRRLTMPVWLAHGSRGSHADCGTAPSPSARWTHDRFDTGALPYFEQPRAFFAHYDAFLARVPMVRAVSTLHVAGHRPLAPGGV